MYLCYLDESGTPDIPGNTSHYVLAGVSIPVECWKITDDKIERIKIKYDLAGKEIHVAWILRSYREQNKIANFEAMSYQKRRQEISSYRTTELLRLQRSKNPESYRQVKKNYRKTEDYVHLTQTERRKVICEMASEVSKMTYMRLFAECIDKAYFASSKTTITVDVQAFEQVVSRFEHYLQIIDQRGRTRKGLLIHDNNETVAKKHTLLMKKFHTEGTLWTTVKNIIETPLFVNSELTTMVQISDLCAYSLRRYLENSEAELFNLIFKRADRRGDIASPVVGVRHFAKRPCACIICKAHTAQDNPILLPKYDKNTSRGCNSK